MTRQHLKIILSICAVCLGSMWLYAHRTPQHKPIECKKNGNVISAYIDTEEGQSISQYLNEGCVLKPELPPSADMLNVYGNVKTAERLLDSENEN